MSTSSDPYADRASGPGAPEDGHSQAPLPEHVAANRIVWDADATNWVEPGEKAWAQVEPTWGMWGLPDDEVALLPPEMAGQQAIELGCGTGYISAWMVRRGATVTAIDNSGAQLPDDGSTGQ